MDTLVTYIAGHAVAVGLTTGQATALTNAKDAWGDDDAAQKTAETALHAATAAKNTSKANLITLARAAINIIQNNPAVTDEVRELMGLPIPDTTRTRAAVPTTKPVATIQTLEHLQHVVNWRDEATPKSKAKPKGVRGAQIHVWVGPNPPADVGQFPWVALDSATPYLMVHDAANAGKTAYYALRWENTRGETGPWSDVVSATITA